MKKGITPKEAAELIPDGAILPDRRLHGRGYPHRLIDALVKARRQILTIIANDTAHARRGHRQAHRRRCGRPSDRLAYRPQSRDAEEDDRRRDRGRLVPQGTLIERIRAGGIGLGGVLTPTGVGTVVKKGKQIDRGRRQGLPAGTSAPGRFRPDPLRRPTTTAICLSVDRDELQPDHGIRRQLRDRRT